LARGISATVLLHPRQEEKRTGGDIGIVLIRPNIGLQGISAGTLTVDEYKRGLLCQAKMNRRTGRGWGPLTRNQQKMLADRTDYLSLLLYNYSDKERRALMPFQWQVCAGSALSDVESWLNSGAFPSLTTSENIIHQLGDCKIGTERNDLMDQLIAPAVRDSLIIKIGWPPGRSPRRNFVLRQQRVEKKLQILHN
jgi:hypothetical protein